MISVCAGYGTDGSRTPTIVAERSPSLMVLPMTDGVACQRRGPEAMGQHRRASRLRPVVGRVEQAAQDRAQPHHVEVAAADDAGADDARFAKADHREIDGGEVADGGQRLGAGANVANLRDGEVGVVDAGCRARSAAGR